MKQIIKIAIEATFDVCDFDDLVAVSELMREAVEKLREAGEADGRLVSIDVPRKP